MTSGPQKPLDSLPNLSRPNLKDEIRLCLAALSRLGLEVLVVNITHPALNLPAVYVLIPGTHFLDRTRNTNVIFHLAKTAALYLSLIHISEPTRLGMISYAVFCLK